MNLKLIPGVVNSQRKNSQKGTDIEKILAEQRSATLSQGSARREQSENKFTKFGPPQGKGMGLPKINKSSSSQKLLNLNSGQNCTSVRSPSSSNKKSRDVSYIYDLNSSGSSRTMNDEKEIYDTLGKAPVLPSAPKLPRSISELRQCKSNLFDDKQISHNQNASEVYDKPSSPKHAIGTSNVFMKTNISKSIPAEFFQFLLKKRHSGVDDYFDVPAIGSTEEEPEKKKLGIPASRSDAIALLNWFNSIMIKVNADGSIKTAEKFLLTQTVYCICFREAIRQVSVQCFERGTVLWKVWQAYLSLISNIGEEGKKKLQNKNFKFEAKIHKLHDHYAKEIEEIKGQIFKMQQECAHKEREINRLKNEMSSQEKAHATEEGHLRHKLNQAADKSLELEELYRRHEGLNNENIELRSAYAVLKRECSQAQSQASRYQHENKKLIAERENSALYKTFFSEKAIQATCEIIEKEMQTDAKKTRDMDVQVQPKVEEVKVEVKKFEETGINTDIIEAIKANNENMDEKESGAFFSVEAAMLEPEPPPIVLAYGHTENVDIPYKPRPPEIKPKNTNINNINDDNEIQSLDMLMLNKGLKPKIPFARINAAKQGTPSLKRQSENFSQRASSARKSREYRVRVPPAKSTYALTNTPAPIIPIANRKVTSPLPKEEIKKEEEKVADVVEPEEKTEKTEEAEEENEEQSIEKKNEELLNFTNPVSKDISLDLDKTNVEATNQQDLTVNNTEDKKCLNATTDNSGSLTAREEKKETSVIAINSARKNPTGKRVIALRKQPVRNIRADSVEAINILLNRELEANEVVPDSVPETLRMIMLNKIQENFKLKQELLKIKKPGSTNEADRHLSELRQQLLNNNNSEEKKLILAQINKIRNRQANSAKKSQNMNRSGMDGRPARSYLLSPRSSSKKICTEIDLFKRKGSDADMPMSMKMHRHFELAKQRMEHDKKQRLKRGQNIIQQFKENVQQKKQITQPLSKKTLLRTISEFYKDLLILQKTSGAQQAIVLPSYICAGLTHKYGLQQVAENKFHQIMESCLVFKHILRVRMFGRFLGLFDEYTSDELKCYLSVLDYLKNLNIGIKYGNNDIEERHFTPYAKAIEYIKSRFESTISPEDYQSLAARIECSKVMDTRGKTPIEVIEIDLFIEIILVQYFKMSDQAKGFMEDLFIAADLNLNGMLSLDEFSILMMIMEPQAFAEGMAPRLFQDYADMTIDSADSLSLQKFASISVKTDLFTIVSQSKLLGKDASADFTNEARLVQARFNIMKPIFLTRLSRANATNDREWDIRLKELEKRLTTEGYSPRCKFLYNFVAIFMSYKLVAEYTSMTLKKAELDRLFPSPFAKIISASPTK